MKEIIKWIIKWDMVEAGIIVGVIVVYFVMRKLTYFKNLKSIRRDKMLCSKIEKNEIKMKELEKQSGTEEKIDELYNDSKKAAYELSCSYIVNDKMFEIIEPYL